MWAKRQLVPFVGSITSVSALPRGWEIRDFRTARKADPTNDDYRQAEAVIGARARTYQQESESRGFGGCVDPSSLCCCLMCGPALCQPFLFCL